MTGPAAEVMELTTANARDAVATVASHAVVVASDSGWAAVGGDSLGVTQRLVPGSLEELALDRIVAAVDDAVDTVVGIGGGIAVDTAKYVALRTGRDLLLVPTALSSIAPFTTEVARRNRRQIAWLGDVAGQVVVDLDLLAGAPAALNRAGAAEIVATISAIWDWRFADSRDKGLPLSPRLVELAERCRTHLGDAAAEIRNVSPAGLRTLAELLSALGAGCAKSGHRRPIDGSEHIFVQSYEHRLGPHRTYGGMVGLGTVAMSTLQYEFGLSAGGPVDPAEAISLLGACGVESNPGQLGLDEGTFRGVLRHTVRFAVGEFLPYSVLNEADVNWSVSEEMWRRCWQVPRVS